MVERNMKWVPPVVSIHGSDLGLKLPCYILSQFPMIYNNSKYTSVENASGEQRVSYKNGFMITGECF